MASHTRTDSAHRDRLLAAMAELVADRGYPAVTVADVVGLARVSKRTFYQYFADREACFLAVYAAAAEGPLRRIADAVTADDAPTDLREQVARGNRAYLDALAEQPALTRTLLTEISSLGPRGWPVRREVLARFADQLSALVAAGVTRWGDEDGLSRPMALALVGGINELVLEAVESGRLEHLPELAPTATDLVVAVLEQSAGRGRRSATSDGPSRGGAPDG